MDRPAFRHRVNGTACAILLACLLPAAGGQPRTWTSSAGTKLKAELVEVKGTVVYLKTEQGKQMAIPVSRLSAADQEWLRNRQAAVKQVARVQAAAGAPLGAPRYTASPSRPFGWRGDGAGLFPGATPPTKWDMASGNGVLWKVDMPEPTHASPILAGNKVITMSDPTWMFCIDKISGTVLWKKSNEYADLGQGFSGRNKPANQFVKTCYGYTCPTPVTDGTHVWATFGHGALVCYDLDGHLKWASSFPTETKQRSGISQSPCLVGDTIVMGAAADYAVAGFDAATGKHLWSNKRHGGIRGKGNFQTVVVSGKPYALISDGMIFNGKDGAILQDNMLGEGGRNYGPTPVVANGVAYLHNLHSKELFATPIKLNASEPPAWKVAADGLSRSPLCINGLVYVPAKQLIVLNASDGKEVYRRDKLPGGWASPALGGKHIYWFSDSTVVVFEPGSEYKEVSSFPVQFKLRASADKNLGASPVFDGNRIYFRGGGALYCFGKP